MSDRPPGRAPRDTALQPPGDRAARITRREALVLCVCAAVMLMMRAWAFDLPLETDEANYAVIGSRLLAGDRLYVDVWDHQPPGVFMLFAAASAAFGDGPLVLRGLASLFSLGSLVLIYLILRRVSGPTGAALGAVLFALVSADPGSAGEGCNREIYMNTLILAAWWMVCREDAPSRWRLLLGGLTLGVASLLKTIVAVHWLALVIWLLLQRRSRPAAQDRPGAANLPRQFACFSLAPALLWAAVFFYFSATGRGSLFTDAVFSFNVGYSDTPEAFFMRFLRSFQPLRHPFIFESARAIWVCGILATLALTAAALRKRRPFRDAILLLIVAGYLALCLPAQFWPHYYYLMLPPLVLATALVQSELAAALAHRDVPPWLPRLLLAAAPAWLGYTQQRDYLSRSPLQITERRYNSRDFWAQAMGHKVASVTEPGDTIFVYGPDAGIYYYSGRRCASRFTMTLALRPEYPDAPLRRAWLMEDLQRSRPRLLLVEPEEPFDAWMKFVADHYEYVGADFKDQDRESVILYVFQDRQRPVPRIEWSWDRAELDPPQDP
ncbi:MAG: glycosyltransferase family 39 protein [Phycisphaerales bacterium]|nr:glycosyltransferase family 39 protein [Phycisphaerales bacterium]